MPKAKRLKGDHEPVELPKLRAEDFKPHLVKGVQKEFWTCEEGAFYVCEEVPKIQENESKKSSYVKQLRGWLKKEHYEGRLSSVGEKDGEPAFTPGDIMRHLLIQEKGFSLKVMSLYHYFETYDANYINSVSVEAYKEAAKIVWREYPSATKAEVIEFCHKLPSHFMEKYDKPLFTAVSDSYLEKCLKNLSPRNAGRQAKSEKAFLEDSFLFDLIEREFFS